MKRNKFALPLGWQCAPLQGGITTLESLEFSQKPGEPFCEKIEEQDTPMKFEVISPENRGGEEERQEGQRAPTRQAFQKFLVERCSLLSGGASHQLCPRTYRHPPCGLTVCISVHQKKPLCSKTSH